MIGNLSYEEIENLITIMASSSENIRSVLNSYQDNNNISSRTEKMLHFCSDIDKYITFVNRGHGDNLGLSLNGSAELAKAGCNYLQILNYYFPTCKIKKYV